jgi:hypothetical protein
MSEDKQKDAQNNANEKADAKRLPPFKLTPPKPGDPPGVYTNERAAADWKMMEAYMEAGSARDQERVLTMKMLPANPGLTDLSERTRSIHQRVKRLREQGKFDAAEEQTAVLDLARVLAAKQKIEAVQAAKRRRR